MKKVNRQRSSSRVTPARWVSFQALQAYGKTDRFIDEILVSEWERAKISSEDRRLCHQLVYGTLRNLYRLDYWIDAMSSKGIESLPEEIVDILRLGLYQLSFLERVPDHAVVDEAVRLCEAVSMGPIKGLVNAVLRRFPDRREELDRAILADPRKTSIQTSHPDWLVKWAVEEFGQSLARKWLHTNNEPAPTYLSPLVSRLTRAKDPSLAEKRKQAVREILKEIPSGRPVAGGEMVECPPGQSFTDLAVIREGRAFVQDLSAREAVRLLDPQPGEKVFDLCAAPGGKTLQIADVMMGQGTLVSVDSNARRVRRLKENLSRCGLDWVRVEQQDLTVPRKDWEETADAVLVDVPCSGLGTLRRKVDLRYRIKPRDIEALSLKARNLLETASRLVCPGGRLVFSTCTLTKEENRGALDWFLNQHPKGWRLIQERKSPAWLYGVSPVGGEVDSDGAYCVRIQKE